MKKTENPFRILYDRFYAYVTASIARRIFFFSFIAVFIIAFYMQFDDSLWAACVLYVACAITAFSTLVDTMQLKLEFTKQLHDLEKDYYSRAIDQHGEEGLEKALLDGAFSISEILYMKKKKREYNVVILTKFLFVIIFVVLFGTALYT